MRIFGSVVDPSRHRQRNFDESLLNVLENTNSSLRNNGTVLEIYFGFIVSDPTVLIFYRGPDYGRSLIFLRQMSTWNTEENIFLNTLLTDEAKFTSSGILNFWNFRTLENPRTSYSFRHQVNGAQFLYFRDPNFQLYLKIFVPQQQRQRRIIQLDGCTAHNLLRMMEKN